MRNICKGLKPFIVMDILEKAHQMENSGQHIVHLEIGQPDFKTPECVNEAARKAILDQKTAYTHSMGILPLREAIAGYYADEYGVTVSPDRIVVTNGTSPALLMLFSALFQKGENAIIADPTYACYSSFLELVGAGAVPVTAKEAQNFQMRPEDVEAAINEKTRAMILNSPANPSGTVIGGETMKRFAEIGRKRGVTLVLDEIYHGLVYEGKAVTALEYSDDACVLDGFSKRYAMTGWRLGWLIAPAELIPLIQVLQQNINVCANSISQWAGIAAIKEAGPDVERMRNEYARRRNVLMAGLRKLGFDIASEPVGAFYVLVNAKHLGEDSLALALDILEKARVAVAPGVDFGPGAEGYLRFSYANSEENIEEGLARFGRYLEMR